MNRFSFSLKKKKKTHSFKEKTNWFGYFNYFCSFYSLSYFQTIQYIIHCSPGNYGRKMVNLLEKKAVVVFCLAWIHWHDNEESMLPSGNWTTLTSPHPNMLVVSFILSFRVLLIFTTSKTATGQIGWQDTECLQKFSMEHCSFYFSSVNVQHCNKSMSPSFRRMVLQMYIFVSHNKLIKIASNNTLFISKQIEENALASALAPALASINFRLLLFCDSIINFRRMREIERLSYFTWFA